MTRRGWTAEESALLRKFHAEGKDDPTIAYIIGRAHRVVHRHRKAMGLKPNGKPGPAKGSFTHTEERKAQIRENITQRWREDEQFRKSASEALNRHRDQGRADRWSKAWRLPTDPEERKLYKKMQREMNTKFARNALRELTST